jgi:hypothetical protein
MQRYFDARRLAEIHNKQRRIRRLQRVGEPRQRMLCRYCQATG